MKFFLKFVDTLRFRFRIFPSEALCVFFSPGRVGDFRHDCMWGFLTFCPEVIKGYWVKTVTKGTQMGKD